MYYIDSSFDGSAIYRLRSCQDGSIASTIFKRLVTLMLVVYLFLGLWHSWLSVVTDGYCT